MSGMQGLKAKNTVARVWRSPGLALVNRQVVGERIGVKTVGVVGVGGVGIIGVAEVGEVGGTGDRAEAGRAVGVVAEFN